MKFFINKHEVYILGRKQAARIQILTKGKGKRIKNCYVFNNLPFTSYITLRIYFPGSWL